MAATIKTSEMTWQPDVREYVTEASDHEATRRGFPREIVLAGQDGWRRSAFATCEKRDGEGELLYVVYGGTSDSGPFTVRIFND